MSNKTPPSEAFPYKAPHRARDNGERQRREAQARAELERRGIRGAVRYEYAAIEEPQRVSDPTPKGRKIWLINLHRRDASAPANSPSSKAVRTGRAPAKQGRDRKPQQCKVELLPDGTFTCSHPGWHYGVDCWHIRAAKLSPVSSPAHMRWRAGARRRGGCSRAARPKEHVGATHGFKLQKEFQRCWPSCANDSSRSRCDPGESVCRAERQSIRSQ